MKDNHVRKSIYLPIKVNEWLENKAKQDKRPFNQYLSVTLEKMMEAEIDKSTRSTTALF